MDIHLAIHLDNDANLGVLEKALQRIGIKRDPKQEGWRWITTVEGRKVKMEFLCDLETKAAQTAFRPAGCQELNALNLRGTGLVAEDWEWEEVAGFLPTGEEVCLRIPFAGLEGYLMSKIHVAKERGQNKDYYDLVYTLLFNKLGGPAPAGEALRKGKFGPGINLDDAVWKELEARFESVTDQSPRGYADEALLADPGADFSDLVERLDPWHLLPRSHLDTRLCEVPMAPASDS